MKIVNKEIPYFADMVFNLKLKGKKNRKRVQMFTMLQNYYNDVFVAEKNALLNEYPERDEEGLPLKESFYVELEELQNEMFYIEKNEQNKDMLLTMVDVILDDDFQMELSGEMAIVFDKWCSECEKVLEFYNQQNESV